MKLRRLLLVLMTPVLFFACSKEKSFEQGAGTSTNQWEFTEGSNLFKGRVDTAYLVELGGGTKGLLFQGTSDDGTGLLGIGISGFNPSAPATYKTPNVQFEYIKSTGVVYENDLSATDKFTLEVTAIDSATVTAVFNGQVKDSTGAIKTITNGKFKARFKNTSTATGDGQATFWAKNSCTAGGNITVTLSNNQTGAISTFAATAPACGATGTASFTVPAGSYAFKAKCGSSDSTVGVITVAANQCTKQEVVFGAAPATGQVSFWAKNSCTAGGNITVKINNQNGTISSFTAAAPANCTATGNANFTLPVGTYTWKTFCGTDSIVGNVTVVASACAKVEVVYPTGAPAQYALVNCGTAQINGTYIVNKPLGDTNNVVVQVNVTTLGSYSIGTTTVNGYTFSKSGNFTTTGIQNVTLQGSGSPVVAGSNTFTATAGTSSCNFNVTVINQTTSATFNTWSFTQGTKTYTGTFPNGADFGDDFFGFGKAVDMFGEIPNTDTTFDLYVQFGASATQPVPGSYTTNPDLFNANTTDLYMYDTNVDIFYVKDFPPLPPTTPTLTIVVTSYDATTKIVKGTFSGTAWNSGGVIVPITNGKFEAEVHF
jgi:hypothetical protein